MYFPVLNESDGVLSSRNCPHALSVKSRQLPGLPGFMIVLEDIEDSRPVRIKVNLFADPERRAVVIIPIRNFFEDAGFQISDPYRSRRTAPIIAPFAKSDARI